MGAIFINYRREDSISTAGRLHDRLALAFGRETIFMDVDHIPAGVDFVEHLNSKIAACKVLLVVIGPNWLNARDEAGQRRLDKPDDFVAIEIEAALVRNIRVIPVLVDGAAIPKPGDLPDSLKRLARRQGVEVRLNHFGRDADALIEKVREALGRAVWRRPQRRWMALTSATAVLLLAGSIALFWFWAPPTTETIGAQNTQADAKRNAEEADQQRRLAAAKAEEERKAKAAVESEAQRNAEEAEQQRLAAAKSEAQRNAKAAAEAEAQRKSQEAEQQRLAPAKVEEQRKAAQKAIIKNLAVRGDDYRRIKDLAIESCLSACVKDEQCKMFAYWGEWQQVCYLFDKDFATYPTTASQVGRVR